MKCREIGLAWLVLSGMAVAAPQVATVRLHRQGGRVHLQAVAYNPDTRWHGPVTIRLHVRPSSLLPWLPLRSWERQGALGPKHKLCRDVFGDSSLLLRLLATGPLYVRVAVTAPGLSGVGEYRFFQDQGNR